MSDAKVQHIKSVKTYKAPTLRVFGVMAKLTAAGTANNNEPMGKDGKMNRP